VAGGRVGGGGGGGAGSGGGASDGGLSSTATTGTGAEGEKPVEEVIPSVAPARTTAVAKNTRGRRFPYRAPKPIRRRGTLPAIWSIRLAPIFSRSLTARIRGHCDQSCTTATSCLRRAKALYLPSPSFGAWTEYPCRVVTEEPLMSPGMTGALDPTATT
jgi:hypothetical protein